MNRHRSLSRSIAFVLAAGITASAMAAPSPQNDKLEGIVPRWAASGRMVNDYYLSRTGVEYVPTLNDSLFFDTGTSRAMREEYDRRVIADENRANAGLSEQIEEKSRFAVMKDYADRAVKSFSKLKMKLEGDKLTKAMKNSNAPRAPIAAAVLAASLYTGRTTNFRIIGDTKIRTRVVLKDRVGEIGVPFESVGATATLAYNHAGEVCGGDNGCALLSKQITPQVSAVLNSAEKGSARLVYSVSF